MMGSLFSSISGLKNHTTWMNTIGNNISNVNTVGYKYSRVTFSDQISQTLGAASGANTAANLGGQNPLQQGLGSSLGSIDTIMTQGAIQTTGSPLDVAITGEGFFTVAQGANNFYTRAGNFLQDNQGNVVTSDGAILQGWMGSFERTIGTAANPTPHGNPDEQIIDANYTVDTTDTSAIGNVTIPNDLRMAAQMTSTVKFSGNLDSMTPQNGAVASGITLPGVPMTGGNITPATAVGLNAVQTDPDFFVDANPDLANTYSVYDSLGNPRSITVQFYQISDPNAAAAGNPEQRPVWAWYAFDTTTIEGSDVYTGEPMAANCLGGTNITQEGVPIGNGETYSPIWFNNDGSLASNGGNWAPATGYQDPYIDPITGEQQYGPAIFLPTDGTNTAGVNPDGALHQEIHLNFGTPNEWDNGAADIAVNTAAGNTPILSAGLRDGVTGDVAGDYQVVGGVSVYQPSNTAYAKDVNGWRSGDLVSLSVDTTGGVVGQFTNDKSITLAKMAMATFLNPQGLEKAGGNLYAISSNSGSPRFTEAGTAGTGTVEGGALESSNVDLSKELTNMIIAQRGFESNARIVSTSADMLDTLVNIGR